MQFLSAFRNIIKIANFWWKNADVSRAKGLCCMIHIFFGSSLGKVELYNIVGKV